MKCFRSVLVGFVIVACFFLTGFKKPVHHHKPSTKNQHLVEAAKHQQKALDLTVPQRDVSFEAPETIAISESTLPMVFTADSQGKARSVELQGKVIMSQEPEIGKIKSADGAGIVINLHH